MLHEADGCLSEVGCVYLFLFYISFWCSYITPSDAMQLIRGSSRYCLNAIMIGFRPNLGTLRPDCIDSSLSSTDRGICWYSSCLEDTLEKRFPLGIRGEKIGSIILLRTHGINGSRIGLPIWQYISMHRCPVAGVTPEIIRS